MVTINGPDTYFSPQDTEIISRRLEGEYHDYKKYIPSISKYNFYANRKGITDILKGIAGNKRKISARQMHIGNNVKGFQRHCFRQGCG